VTRKKALLGHEKMTQEKLLSIVESFLTSRMQYQEFLSSAFSERLSMLGMDGVTSQTDTIAILMDWYDTLSKKQKEKFWTLSLDFITISTPLGTPSRGPSFE
jgi:hypothetical protein